VLVLVAVRVSVGMAVLVKVAVLVAVRVWVAVAVLVAVRVWVGVSVAKPFTLTETVSVSDNAPPEPLLPWSLVLIATEPLPVKPDGGV